MKNHNTLRILLIGRLPPPEGGTTVPCAQLAQALSSHPDVADLKVINTTRVRSFIPMMRVLFNILIHAPKFDVISFYATYRGILRLGPILWCICRVYRKPWLIRLGGGSLDQRYASLPKLAKWGFRKTALKADFCLFETKQLVQFFDRVAQNPVWYPNNRPLKSNVAEAAEESASARRFVFVGQVTPPKGILEIIAAGEQLDSSITVDIYGPLPGKITERDFAELKTVRYCGVLESEEVIPTLRTYDALLLPTYYEGEGYPGVILEAYSAGLPVITTRWRAIPELVDEASGILIEPKDSEQLLAAMKKLITDKRLYQSLCRGVAEKRGFFSSERWTHEFVGHCKSVLRHKKHKK